MYKYENRRHWLMLQCRYYDGEPYPPEHIKEKHNSLFWDYERLWVEWSLAGDGHIGKFKYEAGIYNLTLQREEKTPLTMKELLFNRYLHWGGGLPTSIEKEIRSFEKGLYADYLRRKTNRERRADERRKRLIPQCRLYHGEKCDPHSDGTRFILWLWEKEWVDALADSYSNRQRFFKELMATPCLGSMPLPFWKDVAQELTIPATLLAHIGKSFGVTYHGLMHEMEEDFMRFIKQYARE